MQTYINVNDFKIEMLEPAKLYTLYYNLTDKELNNSKQLGYIIESLWDTFMYNKNLNTNIHLDRNQKLITLQIKLKDNVIVEQPNKTLTSLVSVLGTTILNAVMPLIPNQPFAITVEPLIVEIVDNELKTVSTNPIIKTTIDTSGKLVNSVNDTFLTISKLLPYVPYVLFGGLILLILSYTNTKNLKALFYNKR